MEAEFWRQKWQRNEIGFHEPAPNRLLTAFWERLGLPPGATVLVPLCGKSLDLLWLHANGWRVIGIELSEQAVEAFFAEHSLSFRRERNDAFCRYRAAGLEILCGDFFQVEPEDVGAVAAFYDRAALIALPSPMRRRYVEHLARLAPAAPGLLVTLDYEPAEETLPPFSVDPRAVQELHAGRFVIEPLAREDVLADNPRLLARGLRSLHEAAYLLRPR